MKYKILFILLIFLIPITSFSFDSKQLIRFKVIRICKNCDLSASNLSKEDLNDSIISNTNFKNSDLKKINFENSQLRNVDFNGSNLSGVNFFDSFCLRLIFQIRI